VTFKHRVVFTRHAFATENPALAEILAEGGGRRALVLVETAVAGASTELLRQIREYFQHTAVTLADVATLPGGEAIKADDAMVRDVWARIDAAHLDRHSYLLVIGGGAFLDAAGFAAATAHRGVRLIRFPTTTLAQDDSGVGVKCAINAFGKKNWIGAFAVPFAVINDFQFLHSQPEDTRRAGLIEALKVALVKDAGFFDWIEEHLEQLAALEAAALESCVERSALLHAQHIANGGDPFESGSSRPLDFGHWAAHKLESLTAYRLSHAHAVAIGLALDTLYSVRSGLARDAVIWPRVLRILNSLRLPLHDPGLEMRDPSGRLLLLDGLDEFREHLGGRLTLLMLRQPGSVVEIHQIDPALLANCIAELGRHAGNGACHAPEAAAS
jgi:3-dehydroquinate synthase